ncbi:WD40 repeat-like protein [Rhizoctonia solani]|uniref:WD40 repeat-like protein n=1 Tax=Rhizoctonia solani TaxID=456999 RepID=A0A8H7M243_9AGAM|nr:WD40 repeat-like protein [Rhizoctonia solani]
MEVLNLTGRIDKGVVQVNKATSWLQTKHHPENTMLLARDARRFVTLFATSPVSKSTPHIYVSCSPPGLLHSPLLIATHTDQPGLSSQRTRNHRATAIAAKHDSSWIRSLVCCMFPNGAYIAAGTHDKRVLIWDAVTFQMTIDPIQAHTHAVRAIAISPDSTQVCSASDDWTICVWTYKAEHSLQVPSRHTTARCGRWTTRLTVDGLLRGQLTVLSAYGHIRLANEGRATRQPWQEGGVSCVLTQRYTSGGRIRVRHISLGPIRRATSEDVTMRTWSTSTWQTHSVFRYTGVVRSVRFLPDGSRLVSGSVDGNMRIWEVPDVPIGQVMDGQSLAHEDWVTGVSFSPCGSYLVSGSPDLTVRVWNMQAGSQHAPLSQDTTPTMIYVWERQSGKLEYKIGPIDTDGDYDPLYQEFWPAVLIYDDKRGSPSGSASRHSGAVRCVAFSSQGDKLVSGSDDRTIRIWDVESRTSIAVLEGHTGYVLSVTFSPNGAYAVSGSADTMNEYGMHPRQAGKAELELTNAKIGNEWEACYRPL